MTREEKIAQIKNDNERFFAENFFKHDKWISQPKPIDLGEYTYRPDFYDEEREIYIELVGTKQAFYQNKAKYVKTIEVLGKEKFEIRDIAGRLVDIHPTRKKCEHKFPVYDLPNIYQQYDTATIKLFNELKEKRNMSILDIAYIAFPNIVNSIEKTENIFQGKEALRFSDFLCLCHAFEYEPIQILEALSSWKEDPSWLYKTSNQFVSDEIENIPTIETKIAKYETRDERLERLGLTW
ncbi:hypothetical protein [uncultured Bilophila sp.]|uniref:hypothetical protein n=1 Tax=uncultured Bilophila sp. TaxID=529385 RepID=UPI00266EBBE1|nr:hypothetical protein [uncultured Bilophila sp.]